MNSNIFLNIYSNWNAWNQKIDAFADSAIHVSVSRLPTSCRNFVTTYHTLTKVMLLGLTLFALLKTTFGNSYLPLSLRCLLSTIVIIFTGGPFLSNFLCHSSPISVLPKCDISISNLKSSLCSIIREAVKKLSFQSEIEQIDREIEQKKEYCRSEILRVESMIQKFNFFIRERRDLVNQCNEYLEKDKELLSIILDSVNYKVHELNPNDPIDQCTLSLLKLNELNYLWNERINFIKRHPLLAESMIAHMKQSASGEGPVILLELRQEVEQTIMEAN